MWEDPDDIVLGRLTELVRRERPDLLLPLLAVVFDVDAPTREVEELAVEFRRTKLHEVSLRFLRATLVGPTLIEVEDVHLMDEASPNCSACSSTSWATPWLVVVTRREIAGASSCPIVDGVVKVQPAPSTRPRRSRSPTPRRSRPRCRRMLQLVVERSAGNPGSS